MKLAAIFNVWADVELLEKAVENISKCVDGAIIIFSQRSNYGNYFEFDYYKLADRWEKRFVFQWEPEVGQHPHFNETAKRNYGLSKAKELGYTHFLMMDADEFYFPEDILKDRERFSDPKLNGLVYKLNVLFSKPTLTCHDHTLVPGIQKITPELTLGNYKYYPFAYDKEGSAHIDPTRRPSHRDGIEMSPTVMWHASWIRPDFNTKIMNSSARNNLLRSSIYKDLAEAKEGYYCEFYRQNLKSCPNYFNLPVW